MVFVLTLFHRPSDPSPRLHIASALPSKQLQLPPSPALPVVRTKHPDPSGAPLSTPQLKQDEQASLWKAFSEARREVTPLNDHESSLPFNQGVRLFAQNPGQKLTARFLDNGVRIQSGRKNSDWQATFTATNLPPATSITTQGSRVEYQRGPVIEWYDNKPEGFEQGFIVTNQQGQEGELRVELAVDGLSIQSIYPSTLLLADAQGTARLSYGKLLAYDADGKVLPARIESTSPRIFLIITDTGARYPVTVDPLITSLEQKLGPQVSGDGSPDDSFGFSVSLSAETALVGACNDTTVMGATSGSAYIFTCSEGSWTVQAKLIPSNGVAGGYFGRSVSLSADCALIGAYGYSSTKGYAYVFTRTGSTWSQQAILDGNDTITGDQFGISVSLSGDTALVGANKKSSNGSAYIFTRSGTTWSQQAKLLASDGAPSDNFGYSVSLSGNTALIGANGDDILTSNDNMGSAYVFVRTNSTWAQQTKLTANDGQPSDTFGYSISLSGDTALVGATGHDTEAVTNAGCVYVFSRSGSSWSQQAMLTAADGLPDDLFGCSVSLSGDSAIVGANTVDIAGKSDVGSAYIFTRTGSSWSQQAKLGASDSMPDDRFGTSVSISGEFALIGVSAKDTIAGVNSGNAYIFTRTGSLWSQQAVLTAADAATGDYFGHSVFISEDKAIIGSPQDDSAVGIDAGSAYIFLRSNSIWSEQAKLTADDGGAYDFFGFSVSLYGNTALIGAERNDAMAPNSGSAYLFTLSGSTWSQQAKIYPPDGGRDDYFGHAVSIAGDSVLIGAYGDDAVKGSAYVFTRTGNIWSLQAKLTAPDSLSGDNFASAVSLFEDTALIGAHGDDTYRGSAYIFTRTGNAWSQQAKLIADDRAANDLFGFAVSLSGNSALIGAYGDDNTTTYDVGSAYVFTRNGSSWSQEAKLMPSDGLAYDNFGCSVSISDGLALIGAFQKYTGAANRFGSAYIFGESNSLWTQQAKLEPANGSSDEQFGWSVSLSGNTALVGTRWDDGFSLTGEPSMDQGSVHVFRLFKTSTNDTDYDGASDAWEGSHGFDPSNANDISTLDSDGDGDRDLLEIFQGTGRYIPSEHHSLINAIAILDSTTYALKTRYRRSTTQTAVYGSLKWSPDLINWYAPGVDLNGVRINIAESVVESGIGYEIVEATAKVTLGNPRMLFLTLSLQPVE